MTAAEIRLPESELQAMEALWEKGPCTVRDIREAIEEKRGEALAHSTVVTMLQRLEKKGLIQKTGEQVGKAFIFKAVLKPDRAQQHFLKKYLTRFLGNDPIPVFSWLIESGDLNMDEIAQVRKMLEAQERKQKGDADD